MFVFSKQRTGGYPRERGAEQQGVEQHTTTRYYLGNYEKEIDFLGNTKKIHYLSGGAMLIIRDNVETLYYAYSDYLGSLLALTDESGNVVEHYAYDPWGQRRNPTDWTQTDSRTTWIVNRGYAGHEHLDAFSIINMNGRVYDPLTASFFSPDPYVQAPDNWLNYNRYAYAYGNPFKYTDPDGEWVHIVIGAVVGGVVNLTIKAIQGKIHNFGDGLAAFGIGVAAGAVGALTGGAAFVAAGGGAAGAGGFLAGAAGGLGGTAFASPLQSMGNSMYFGDPLMTGKDYLMGLGIGALTGGAFNGISALTNGRDFWNGSLIPKDIRVTMPTVDVSSIVGEPSPIKNPLSDIGVAENRVNNLKLNEIAEKLKSGIIEPKPYQELNAVIVENNLKLTFRIESHRGLDKVFEGVSRTDIIRHANVRLEQLIDGKWIAIPIKGTNTNFHIWLEFDKAIKINGLK
jgi:RHS repeat-associated protein